jgi:tRNA A-37 threonylcarbamoyl transferase component Bud32
MEPMFDEYREETLQQLEEEQREFREFLQRLRRSRDRQEFDRYMAARRAGRPAPPIIDGDARAG